MSDVRLIDANALLDFISDERKEASDNKNHEKMRGNDHEMHFWSGALAQARWIRQHIKETPTIDAAPVVHAYWYGSEFDGYADGNPVYDTWGCSHCHEEVSAEGFPPAYDYCPYCGAKMDGGAEND